jgi:hypothetical protein
LFSKQPNATFSQLGRVSGGMSSLRHWALLKSV